MKSLFLTGNYPPLIVRDTFILLGFAVFFLWLAFYLSRKELEE